MGINELEDKTFKMRFATLISIIGGVISICIIVATYVSNVERKLDALTQSNIDIKESVKEIKSKQK